MGRMRGIVPVLVALSACRGGSVRDPGQPAAVSRDEFKSLAWLEGHWVGRQPDGSGFYEEYRFKDDSTIGTWGFADSAATVAHDSGEIRLRSGQVTSGNDLIGWVVTSLDTSRVDFAPLHGAQNSFTWTRRPDGGWIAKLHWPADGSRPARDVEYRLQRRSALQAGLADRCVVIRLSIRAPVIQLIISRVAIWERTFTRRKIPKAGSGLKPP